MVKCSMASAIFDRSDRELYMKKLLLCVLLCSCGSIIASAQSEKRFPGVSAQQLEMLSLAKQITPLPLPTWLPNGFKVEKIDMRLGSMVEIQDKRLAIIYSRKLANGNTQRFALDAGFEGLGDLPYDTTSTVRSALGDIDIAYQPPNLDEGGKKLDDFAMTHWFHVGKTAFHYDGMYGAQDKVKNLEMISLADTRKILQSLQRF